MATTPFKLLFIDALPCAAGVFSPAGSRPIASDIPEAAGAQGDRRPEHPRDPAGDTPAPHLPGWRSCTPVPTSKLLRGVWGRREGWGKAGGRGRGEIVEVVDFRALKDLFAPGRDTLIIYNMMFPRHLPTPGRNRQAARWPSSRARIRLSVLPRAGRPVRWRGTASGGGRLQLRRHRQDAAGAAFDLRPRKGLAACALPVVGEQQLQARLPERIRRRQPERDAAGVPPHEDGIRHFWSSEIRTSSLTRARTSAPSARWSLCGTSWT